MIRALTICAIATAGAQAACPFSNEVGHMPHGSLRSVFEDLEDADYQSQSRADKMTQLKDKILATPSEGDWPNALEMAGLFTESMAVTEDNAEDEFPHSWIFQRKKLIHSVGYIADIEFQWKDHSYTGLFSGADTGFIRCSLAAEPNFSKGDATSGNFRPGFGIKMLRDGVPSGNLVALRTLTPVDSWNFFKYPMSNHLTSAGIDDTASKLLLAKFKTVSDWPGYLGLSSFARHGQDGTEVSDSDISFPFQLVFHPNADLQTAFPDTGANLDLFSSQLATISTGTTLYGVYAKSSHDATEEHIGDIVTRGPFSPSEYGDETLFLQHTRFEDDLKLRPDFLDQCPSFDGCKACPVEEDC